MIPIHAYTSSYRHLVIDNIERVVCTKLETRMHAYNNNDDISVGKAHREYCFSQRFITSFFLPFLVDVEYFTPVS